MKKYTMIATLVAAVIFNAAAYAQATVSKHDCRFELAKLNYLAALRSDNVGLKESSMMQTVKIKMVYPEANFEQIKNVIDSLAVNGKTPSIRYKAYLASNVLENPAWFATNDPRSYENADPFFAAVALQLQERILGSRTN